jgi:hypothetical protein
MHGENLKLCVFYSARDRLYVQRKFLLLNLKSRNQLEDVGMDEIIIVKWSSKKIDVRM